MSGESLLIILVIGLISGWLAGQIVRGMGFGLVADLGAQILHTVDRRNWKISLFLPRLVSELGSSFVPVFWVRSIESISCMA